MKISFICQSYESLGVEILSNVLKSHGHHVQLCVEYDYFADGLLDIPFLHQAFHFQEKIVNELKTYKPDLVAFSVVTDYYQWAKILAAKIKKETNLPIIFGGIHPTVLPDLVLQNNFVDLVCRGEGEYAILELADRFDLKGEIDPVGIKNLSYKKNKRIISEELRPLVENLDKLPFGDKKLFYDKMPRLKEEYWIMTSRGCPFGCSYCWNSYYRNLYCNKGKYLRRRSVDNVLRELIEAKDKWKYKRICFLDDLFTYDVNWLKEFSQKLKKTKVFRTPYSCTGHPKFINSEITKILKESGCYEVELGVQTANEKTRREVIFRPETNEEIIKSSKLIKEAGMDLFLDHIGALPGEGEKEQIEAVKLYNEIRPTYVSFFWLRHYPGTEIQKIALRKKEINKKHIEKMKNGEGVYDPYRYYGKRSKEFVPFEYLIGLITILPPKVVDYILKKRIYRFFNKPSLVFGQGISRLLVALVHRDFRLVRGYLKRYKEMFSYLFLSKYYKKIKER